MGVIKPVSKKVKQNKMILANTQIDAPLQTTNNVRTYVAVCWSLRLMNRCIKWIAPNDVNTRITYTGHKTKH